MTGTGETVLMQEMTWQQVEAALAAGKTTAVFACGAIEQCRRDTNGSVSTTSHVGSVPTTIGYTCAGSTAFARAAIDSIVFPSLSGDFAGASVMPSRGSAQ